MVAVTRRGVKKTPRRVVSGVSRVATTSRGSRHPSVVSHDQRHSGSATIALPGNSRSVRLEDIPYDSKHRYYLPSPEQYSALLAQGWTPVSFRYAAASRVVEESHLSDDPSDVFVLSDVQFFSRYVVLQKRRVFGTREYVDEIVVRMPTPPSFHSAGWRWLEDEALA